MCDVLRAPLDSVVLQQIGEKQVVILSDRYFAVVDNCFVDVSGLQKCSDIIFRMDSTKTDQECQDLSLERFVCGFTESRASGINFMQLLRVDADSPITAQTFKWSEITGVSVDSAKSCMKIKIADAEISLEFCSGIEQYLQKQILSSTDVITTPEPDVLPFDICLTPDVQLAIVLLVMKYKLSDSAA